MKLVELLAREMEEWPEGCFEAYQSGVDLEVYLDGSDEVFLASEAADDRGVDKCGVTREMWEAERAKLASTAEWDGEGLPPVGAKCEARAVTGISEFKWIEVKVEFISEKGVFLTSNELTGGCIGLPVKYVEFRPIRTPEQIAANVRNKAVGEMVSVWKRTMGRFAEEERGLAEMLYDAGYRKQEKSE